MNAVVEQRPTFPAEQPAPTAITPMMLIDRAMAAGNLDLVKQFMELQERWEANQARKAFEAAMASAKAEIKPIVKRREVDFTSQKGRTNYMHEDYAAVAEEVDPILAKYGLNIRHRPKQQGKSLTIICKVAHRDGHFEETELTADNDESGNKNSIQALGSTATYLQRYTVKLALGLAASKDDDGRGAGKQRQEPQGEPAPEGYDNWHADMKAKADEGLAKLTEAWQASSPQFRRHVVKWDEDWWLKLKAQAAKVVIP